MKKLLSTLLALSLALSLGACAVKVEPDKPDEPAKDELRVVFTEEHLTKEVEYKADDGTVLLIEKYDLPQRGPHIGRRGLYAAGQQCGGRRPAGIRRGACLQRRDAACRGRAGRPSAQEALAMAREHYAGLDEEQRAYWANYAEELIVDDICQFSGLVSAWGGVTQLRRRARLGEHPRLGFDLTTGEFLTLDSLDAQPSTDSALGESLTHTLAMAVLEQIDAQGLSEYYFEITPPTSSTLPPTRASTSTTRGLTIVFAPAVIAPYAASAQKFEIPYSRFHNALDATRSHCSMSAGRDHHCGLLHHQNALVVVQHDHPARGQRRARHHGGRSSLARVTLGDVNTLDELRALLCEHVSAELADEWLATGRFVESDGALYAAWADRGSDITIDTESYLVAWNGDTGEIMQTITRREWNDETGDFVPVPGSETYYGYPFTTMNRHAVFSRVPLPLLKSA